MDLGLAGRVAVVTGGASGIGRAIAAGLEAEGVVVAVVDASESALGHLRIQTRLGDPATSRRVIEQVVAELGSVDILVNCAAVARHEPVTQISPESWEATISSNLAACVWTCRAAARQMILRGRGVILIVGSTSLDTPAPSEGVYRASKAGLKAFAEVMAIELAPHGIRVNILTPGAVKTALTAGISEAQRQMLKREIPFGREAVPEELVPTALLLLSDILSPYTTGADVTVDGGLHLRPLTLLSGGRLAELNESGIET